MMQTQWPGHGTGFDLSALESPLGGDDGSVGTARNFFRPQPPDGVARPWWASGAITSDGQGTNSIGGLFGTPNASHGSIAGIITGLLNLLQQLVGSFLNQSQPTTPAQTPTQLPHQNCVAGGSGQRFENVDVSSTGDPHLAAVGTREGGGAVDARWDSMTSQNDLVHSTQIDGGYRVSTTVTQAGANGVTSNQSATVHANFDQDAVTMNRDGSFAIYDNGAEVRLGKGESAVLSGGETVSENQDGSLVVGSRSATGGTIATTLRANGAGVDVTTHAHDIAVGGDVIAHADRSAPARQDAHDARAHGHARPHRGPGIVQKTALLPPLA
ncbi:MAG: hypothetical protein M3169_03865 [Candidatus Eremiobacteraeota bacterium]|nr:hypothetical protein [Candidatus Eremiobacteraeota bacterium]